MTLRARPSSRLKVAIVAAAAAVLAGLSSAPAQADDGERGHPQTVVVDYDSATLAQYQQKWSNIYGPLDGVQPVVKRGAVRLRDVPFKPGTDFSVFDHLKYIAVSNQSFPVPAQGSVRFSVDIKARTPGARVGHVVHGVYGPPGAWSTADATSRPYAAKVLQGQQAGVVLNMIDFCTGQLFDWFVSGDYAFPLIERLPTAVTGNTTSPSCPGATFVGLDKAYTQIIKNIKVRAGVAHHVAITYTHRGGRATVSYLLDGREVASVDRVGVPLDQRASWQKAFSGTYPSVGPGEPLADQISSFSIGHGLFSLLDAFPFQYGCTPPSSAPGVGTCDPASAADSVSISPAERSFGQGADGTFSNFRVLTRTR